MHTTHPHLYKAALRKLRPTQITVGYAEVQDKQAQWMRMGKGERKKFLRSHWFPAVRGPQHDFYIVDHHHLGRALLDTDVENCHVVLLKDLSHLKPAEFWVVMDHHQWVHPYDSKGQRQSVGALPHTLDGLADDPYRSVAGEVRKAGGFPKDSTPFAEFLWADFFRRRIAASLIRKAPAQALQQAMSLCHSPDAAHLPGWTAAPAPANGGQPTAQPR